MNWFLTSASRAEGLDGIGSMRKWLIAGALTCGIVPVSVQAQDPMERIAPATLFGLPAENGRVQWPHALRFLPPDNETKALREQLELVLYFVATQAAEGKVNRVFIDVGLEAVHDLRHLLRPRKGIMLDIHYTEAMRFLDRAERGLTRIKRIETSPEGACP
jgi:hypothetical protein